MASFECAAANKREIIISPCATFQKALFAQNANFLVVGGGGGVNFMRRRGEEARLIFYSTLSLLCVALDVDG
jgi:hypothetical protein